MNYFNNNKNSSLIIIVLILLNLITLSVIIFTKPETTLNRNNPMEEMRQERMSNFINRELQLNNDQHASFQQSRIDFTQTKQEAFSQIQKSKRDLYKEVFKENPNKGEIEKLVSNIGNQHKILERAQLKHFKQIKGFCNPSQCNRFNNIVDEMVDVMGNRQQMRDNQRYRNRRNRRGRQ